MKKVIVILCTVSVFTLISNVAAQTDQEAFVFIENIYKEQIAENPLDYKPFALLAQMYSDQKDYEKAEQIYNDALEYHSSVAIMNHIVGNHYYFKARNLGEQKYFHQAIEYYLKTAELEPQNAVMYNNIGLAYTRLNDYDQAITAFQKAIALDENYGCAHYNLGFSYCTIGDYPQAEKTLLKVIELNQYDVKALKHNNPC
jgi:tetratricopeptide (TPR) repeat protein